jgi:glycosyltransferase involved in cell wall biosynthesis
MGQVALVHDFLYTFGGAEQVLLELHTLFPNAPIYTAFYDPAIVAKHFPNATIRTSSLQRSPLKRKPQLLAFKMPRAVEEWDFSSYDTVISSSGAFSHGIITGPDTFHLCYSHSPMRYAWDWHAENLSERGLTGPLKVLVQRKISGLRLWDQVAAKRVDAWIANSVTVQARIAKYYRADSTVVYPPVSLDTISTDRGNFFLTVGRLTANKHVELMIRASHDQNVPLLVVGTGPEYASLKELSDRLGSPVTFAGRVSDEEKRRLLASASAFLFAAEDDFGIAPVEALAAGTPVIALGRGGVTETVRDGQNGLLFPDQSAASLEMAIARFKNGEISLSAAEIMSTAQAFGPEAFREGIQKALTTHA